MGIYGEKNDCRFVYAFNCQWACIWNKKLFHENFRELKLFIVNSDAHDPSGIGEFRLTYKLLKEVECDERLILNNDLEEVKKFVLS